MVITKERIRELPVVLDLKHGINPARLTYIITEPGDYEKIEHITAEDAVNLVLQYYKPRDSYKFQELEKDIKNFIDSHKNKYSICVGRKTLECVLDTQDKIHADHRKDRLMDYLVETKDKAGNQIIAAFMRLDEPTHLG